MKINSLSLSEVRSAEDGVSEQELGHDEGLQGHVERRAYFLTLKQVWVVTNLLNL